MGARLKVSAFLTARSSRNVEGGTTLFCVFNEAPRRTRRFRAYIELSDLSLGQFLRVQVVLCDASDDEVWEPVWDETVVRRPRLSWVLGLDGKALRKGRYLLYLLVNGNIEDTHSFDVR